MTVKTFKTFKTNDELGGDIDELKATLTSLARLFQALSARVTALEIKGGQS